MGLTMTAETDLLQRVRNALRADTTVAFDEASIVLALSDGSLLIDGEVADVSVKRRLLRSAAAMVAPRGIIDRLRVRPATPMEDGMIADLVRDALMIPVGSLAELEHEGYGIVLERLGLAGGDAHQRFLIEGRFDLFAVTAQIMVVATPALPLLSPGAHRLSDIPLRVLWQGRPNDTDET
jgi:hypothetical protein